MAKETLEPNKVYNLFIPESETTGRVGYLGETYTQDGKLFFWIYQHVQSNRVNRITAISLEDGNFLCDGTTISPVPERRWGMVHAIVDINDPSTREKCSKLITKLKALGAVPESA